MAEPLPPEFLRAIEQREGVFTAGDAASYGVSESQVRAHIKARRRVVSSEGCTSRSPEAWGLTTAPIRVIHLTVPAGRRPLRVAGSG
ncbi:MAG: hypothetical protein ACR2F6_11100 [Mycobacteriales bacterium]